MKREKKGALSPPLIDPLLSFSLSLPPSDPRTDVHRRPAHPAKGDGNLDIHAHLHAQLGLADGGGAACERGEREREGG
jgi:hypothetical protein